ncbi:GNAT family N-acetyltransferase [Nonlabens xiamenensis]|uniref:GNAT family N-acetyltransferase n=1 Tax=Nonlabens xiamenensis TaxID=2341043 RepID=UPI000F608547|nr:GNAT family N-acetyltransferase [Nonlabens xiamenensis]
MEIRPITARETFPVRHPVLRKGRPMEECRFSGDDLGTTFHLGAFDQDQLVGVATFLMNKDIHIPEIAELKIHQCYQLRGMAVLEQYQGKNIGKRLLKKALEELKDKQIKVLWFNARAGAVSFYEAQGYQITGEIFEVPGIGPHLKMFKKL